MSVWIELSPSCPYLDGRFYRRCDSGSIREGSDELLMGRQKGRVLGLL